MGRGHHVVVAVWRPGIGMASRLDPGRAAVLMGAVLAAAAHDAALVAVDDDGDVRAELEGAGVTAQLHSPRKEP